MLGVGGIAHCYRYSRLLDSHRFTTFVFRNLYRLQMLAPASSGFLRVFPVLHRVQQLSSLVTTILSYLVPPLASWGCLLGVLSSVSALVLEACSLPLLSSAAVVCSGLSLLLGCLLPVGTSSGSTSLQMGLLSVVIVCSCGVHPSSLVP